MYVTKIKYFEHVFKEGFTLVPLTKYKCLTATL